MKPSDTSPWRLLPRIPALAALKRGRQPSRTQLEQRPSCHASHGSGHLACRTAGSSHGGEGEVGTTLLGPPTRLTWAGGHLGKGPLPREAVASRLLPPFSKMAAAHAQSGAVRRAQAARRSCPRAVVVEGSGAAEAAGGDRRQPWARPRSFVMFIAATWTSTCS